MSSENEKEQGIKWWMRYVIVPIIGGGGIVAIIVALLANPPNPIPIPPPSPTSNQETPTVVVTTEVTPPINIEGPFREHQTVSIGTGVFAQVTSSDGLASYTEDWLWANNHFNIQRLRLEENPNGCGISVYNTDKVWFSASANATVTVNGKEIGKLAILTGKHGYIFSWPIRVNDEICAVNFGPSGYQIVIGPDIYYHYDSYCYRGGC